MTDTVCLNCPSHYLRVLIVDNHQDSLEIAAEVLKADCNAYVFAVNTAQQAYNAVSIFQPDLLISELCLPEEDGYVLIEKLKRYMADQNHYIPAIALTTQVSLEAKARAFAAGYCHHIAKPYDFETLAKTVLWLTTSDAPMFAI
ncbi:MAG: response regulator [Leptolyngbyaceae bacterium]|nr:response regulator [Leptolyngbyaceae bacterium]